MKIVLLLSLLIASTAYSKQPKALFAPYQGEKAFETIYEYIENAQEYAHITIYSWSDAGVTKAMENLLIKNPKIKLRVVLHRPLARKEKILDKVAKLEKLGAMFKQAKHNMHEKFILVDSDKLINSSANMSSGAKKKYAEDFVIIDSDGEIQNEILIQQFEKEFAALWDTADDIVTKEEINKPKSLNFDFKKEYVPLNEDFSLISSSMNFKFKPYKENSSYFKKGRTLRMSKIKKPKEGLYTVSNSMIKAIDNAKENILLSLNHFNLYSVSEALIRAVKRGVEVRLFVDNQEFKTRIRDEGRKSIEMTPRFVRDFKKIPEFKNIPAPVRIRFYSHAPHHSSWLLNHHKYMLVDYNKEDLSQTILFSGSFNISENAEYKQFDNLVKYTGEFANELFHAYAKNHEMHWNFNRNKKDQPKASALEYFTKVHKDSYVRIHASGIENAVSLTWDEAIKLKKDIAKIAPGFFSKLFNNKGCYYYDFVKKSYFGACR